jgi:hypothetical protein
MEYENTTLFGKQGSGKEFNSHLSVMNIVVSAVIFAMTMRAVTLRLVMTFRLAVTHPISAISILVVAR